MNAFLILFGLALAVIQIIMIIKFFEIASDIRAIKNFFLNQYVPDRNISEKSEQIRDAEAPTNPITSYTRQSDEIESKGPSGCVIIGIIVVFVLVILVTVLTK